MREDGNLIPKLLPSAEIQKVSPSLSFLDSIKPSLLQVFIRCNYENTESL